jgi:hypothetical protein
MPTCRLIVCEKSSPWAAALRGALAGNPPGIVETRSLGQTEAALEESPCSLAAIEVTASNLEAVVDFIERSGRLFPQARWIGLIAPEIRAAEGLLREAGANDVLASLVEIDRPVRFAQRQFALAPAAGPLTMHEFVAERLPWPAYATQG